MNIITNLTRYKATPEQIKSGVRDIKNMDARGRLIMHLTFTNLPTPEEIRDRAYCISLLAYSDYAMIDGASYLMPALEKELIRRDVIPLYPVLKRVIKLDVDESGKEIRTITFKHLGFVKGACVNKSDSIDNQIIDR